MKDEVLKKWWPIRVVADASLITSRSVQRWCSNGKLPSKRIKLKATKVEGMWFVKGEDLKEFLRKVGDDSWEFIVERLGEYEEEGVLLDKISSEQNTKKEV